MLAAARGECGSGWGFFFCRSSSAQTAPGCERANCIRSKHACTLMPPPFLPVPSLSLHAACYPMLPSCPFSGVRDLKSLEEMRFSQFVPSNMPAVSPAYQLQEELTLLLRVSDTTPAYCVLGLSGKA
ncbi:hypothetical protein cyc_01253 [Cyclospora cayetanensis]|uniref:Uncharacterized protein n=1 Tax=Cyclospora cayetanensis TaxID=88456 RepID=A0A1D3CYW1_9EIME|nr:hypothetical protein cyc_01253 [Cyclospora cayetanensis]